MKRLYSVLFLITSSLGNAADASPSANASRMSIEETISRALTVSPLLKSAQAGEQAQREKKRGSWSDLGPRVKVNYNEVRFDDTQVAPMNGQLVVIRPKQTKVGQLQVLQPITGAIALQQNAGLQGANQRLLEAETSLTESNVAFSAAEAWLRAYQADRQLAIADASILATESQLKDARALERAERLNRGDVLKLELMVSESKTRSAQARAFREIAFASLREAVGLAPDAEINLDNSLPQISALSMESEQALTTAFARRVELTKAREGADIAGYGKKLAYTQFVPNVNVFLQYEHNYGELSAFSSQRQVRSYGIQASWDIWNNGSSVFAIREASQRQVQAEEGVRGVETMVRMDVLSAFANLRAARESLELAKVADEQATEAYRIEKVRFSAGTRSATDLVLAETSATGSKIRNVTAQTDWISSQLKCQKALGEGRPQFTKP